MNRSRPPKDTKSSFKSQKALCSNNFYQGETAVKEVAEEMRVTKVNGIFYQLSEKKWISDDYSLWLENLL